MSVENGVIKEPINISDPYKTMGVGMYNGWFDLAYICSNLHGKTNKWSKKKPIASQSPIELTDDDSKLLYYGMSFKEYISIKSVCDDYPTEPGGWEYNHPVVNKNFMRLTDWLGYNHNAKRQVFNEKSPPIQTIGESFTCSCAFRGISTDGSLDITSISEFENWYFGVALKNIGDKRILWKTSNLPFKSGDCTVLFPSNTFSLGENEVRFFISDTKKTDIIDPDVAARFVSLPLSILKTVFVKSLFSVNILAWRESGIKNPIKGSVSITNNSSIGKTLSVCSLQLRLLSSTPDDPFVSGEQSINLGNIYVDGNSTKKIEGIFEFTEYDTLYKVWFTSNTDNIRESVIVLDTAP